MNKHSAIQQADTQPAIVAIIPAAGRATRLGSLPCSKELLPVGFQAGNQIHGMRPKPVSQYLVEQMVRAGCQQLYFVVRPGKWDIANYFGHGQAYDLDIAYLQMHAPYGPPFTLNQASPFVREAIVMMGFPDILLAPSDAFSRALARLQRSDADVVVGTMAAKANDGCDLVVADASGVVSQLVPKEYQPSWSDTSHAWLFAVWRPSFTAFLEQQIRLWTEQADHAVADGQDTPEWPVGAVMVEAMKEGLTVQAEHFIDGQFLDVGTPERLARANQFPGVWNGLPKE